MSRVIKSKENPAKHHQHADDNTRMSVIGYTNRIQKDLQKGWIIPLSIKCLCISFYFANDYFVNHGNNIQLLDRGKVAKGGVLVQHKRNTVYGHYKINLSPENQIYAFKWTLKANQIDPDAPGYWIGINNSNTAYLNSYHLNNKNNNLYSLSNHGKIFYLDNALKGSGYNYDKLNISWGKEAEIVIQVAYKAYGPEPSSRPSSTPSLRPTSRPSSTPSYRRRRKKKKKVRKVRKVEKVPERPKAWQILWEVNGERVSARLIVKPGIYYLAAVISESGQELEIMEFEKKFA